MHLQEFVKKVIEVKNGLVEEKGDKIELLLPKELQDKLEVDKEYLQLTLSTEKSEDDKLLTYGSPILDKIISLTDDIGRVSSIFIKEVDLRSSGLEKFIEKEFNFLNAKRSKKVLDRNIACSYLLINYKCSIISDTKYDEIIQTLVDEHTLRAPINIIDRLLAQNYELTEPEIYSEPLPLDKIYEKSKKIAIRILENKLKEVEATNINRLKRDIERIYNYYNGLREEVKKRYLENEETYQTKIKAIEVEFNKKKQDLLYKYSMKINLEPINILRIYLPKMTTEYLIKRKDKEKVINFYWEPINKSVEPLVCESCLDDTFNIYLCDNLHLLCPNCYIRCSNCDKKLCKNCSPDISNTCPNCNKELHI